MTENASFHSCSTTQHGYNSPMARDRSSTKLSATLGASSSALISARNSTNQLPRKRSSALATILIGYGMEGASRLKITTIGTWRTTIGMNPVQGSSQAVRTSDITGCLSLGKRTRTQNYLYKQRQIVTECQVILLMHWRWRVDLWMKNLEWNVFFFHQPVGSRKLQWISLLEQGGQTWKRDKCEMSHYAHYACLFFCISSQYVSVHNAVTQTRNPPPPHTDEHCLWLIPGHGAHGLGQSISIILILAAEETISLSLHSDQLKQFSFWRCLEDCWCLWVNREV